MEKKIIFLGVVALTISWVYSSSFEPGSKFGNRTDSSEGLPLQRYTEWNNGNSSSSVAVNNPPFSSKQSTGYFESDVENQSNWREDLDHGSLKGFPTYAEAVRFLGVLLLTYPTLLRRFPIGISYEGRILYAYALRNTSHSDTTELASHKMRKSRDRAAPIAPPTFDVHRGMCLARNYSGSDISPLDALEARLRYAEPLSGSEQRKRDNMRFDKNKTPRLLFTALHHAREPASLTTLLNFIGRLLETATLKFEQRQQDAKALQRHVAARYLLQNREIVVVPFVNPDGYVAIEKFKDYTLRKNRRPTCNNPLFHGVDLNRNYGYKFLRNHTPCDAEEYEGKFPFSEPETRAIQCLTAALPFQIAVNIHAYGNILTKPFNCCKGLALPPIIDRAYKEIAACFNGLQMASAPELPQLGYETSGEADDWMLSVRGIISLSAEVGAEAYEFWPPPAQIHKISDTFYQPFLSLVSKSGYQLFVRDVPVDDTSSDLFITNKGLAPLEAPEVWLTVFALPTFLALRSPGSAALKTHTLSSLLDLEFQSNVKHVWKSSLVTRVHPSIGPLSTVGPITFKKKTTHSISLELPFEQRENVVCILIPSEMLDPTNAYCHCEVLARNSEDVELVYLTLEQPICLSAFEMLTRDVRRKENVSRSFTLYRNVWRTGKRRTLFFFAVAALELVLVFLFVFSFCVIISESPKASTNERFTRLAISSLTKLSSLCCCFPLCLRYHRHLRKKLDTSIRQKNPASIQYPLRQYSGYQPVLTARPKEVV